MWIEEGLEYLPMALLTGGGVEWWPIGPRPLIKFGGGGVCCCRQRPIGLTPPPPIINPLDGNNMLVEDDDECVCAGCSWWVCCCCDVGILLYVQFGVGPYVR